MPKSPADPEVVVYFHDPVEVDPRTSWTGLAPSLRNARRVDIAGVVDPRVTDLFDFARPDAVVTVDGRPVVAIEQTQMNPSGHNIPQRFSFHLRAAELGVPSILYYPQASRRTFSDPNVRYVQVRVPLAQRRLSEIFGVPVLSSFWPTDPNSLLPDTRRAAHQEMADLVESFVVHGSPDSIRLPAVQRALQAMDRSVVDYESNYRVNQTVREYFPDGIASSRSTTGRAIDPPDGVRLVRTSELISRPPYAGLPRAALDILGRREFSLVYTGTANAKRTDSEHPWPGYLTLFDALYARESRGRTSAQRMFNLIYVLPNIPSKLFGERADRQTPPTATFIVDSFADAIVFDDGIRLGAPTRKRLADARK